MNESLSRQNKSVREFKKVMNNFCKTYGLNYVLSLTTEVSMSDGRWATIVGAPNERVKIDLNNIQLTRKNLLKELNQKGAMPRIEESGIKHMSNILKKVKNKNLNLNNVNKRDRKLILYLRKDSLARESFSKAVKNFQKPEVVDSLPFFNKYLGRNRIMEHESIHYILDKNGINFTKMPLAEGVCVYLHNKIGGRAMYGYFLNNAQEKAYLQWSKLFELLFDEIPPKPIPPKQVTKILIYLSKHETELMRVMQALMTIQKTKSVISKLKNICLKTNKSLAREYKDELKDIMYKKRELRDEKIEERTERNKYKLVPKIANDPRKINRLFRYINTQIRILGKEFRLGLKDNKDLLDEKKWLQKSNKFEKIGEKHEKELFKNLLPIVEIIEPEKVGKLKRLTSRNVNRKRRTEFLNKEILKEEGQEFYLNEEEKELLIKMNELLETQKEILIRLAEIYHDNPKEVEELISILLEKFEEEDDLNYEIKKKIRNGYKISKRVKKQLKKEMRDSKGCDKREKEILKMCNL